MPEPDYDKSPDVEATAADPRPLRFVSARPESQQARRATKAAIRAHASQASWAKIRAKGKQTRTSISKSQTASASRSLERSSDDGPSKSYTELPGTNDTDAEPASNDALIAGFGEKLEVIRPSVLRQNIPWRATHYNVARVVANPSPIDSIAAGSLDPFTTYPSQLPGEIASPLMVKGKFKGCRKLVLICTTSQVPQDRY
jgi:hypothetical protein